MSTKNTRTSVFGVSNRESHDSRLFYHRALYAGNQQPTNVGKAYQGDYSWANQIYCQSSERMGQVPDSSIGLAFTSPPYNVGKEVYDADLTLEEYLDLIARVGQEVYRTLVPGGRYVINVANLGRKPYISLVSLFQQLHAELGFLPVGEVIWRKAKGASGSVAWGSWRSSKAPVLRDVHETLIVFTKGRYGRPERLTSTISKEEFMAATLSVWEIPPASAKRIGHPAPFPVALAERVVQLYSFQEDVVLDPFCGAGTTCVAAKKLGRKWVGYDIITDYVELSRKRIQEISF